MKIAHLSLGPTCVPAELLKASHLRTCSFGFDWFRSGSFFIEEFFRLPLTSFLERYVYNPCIPLRQNIPAGTDASLFHTIEPFPIEPLFGYNYLYNPHRELCAPETRTYFYRAFKRLRKVLVDEPVLRRYVVADYTNKAFGSHLNKSEALIEWFVSLSQLYDLSGELYIVRMELNPSKVFDVDVKECSYSERFRVFICGISYWKDLDNEESRVYVYQKIGRTIFGAIPRNRLWEP